MHVVIHYFRLGPLFELDDNDVVFPVFIGSDQDEIHPLRGLGNVILDCNLDSIVNVGIIDNVPHELHGILPCGKFAVLPGVQAPFPNEVENLCRDYIRPDILDELSFVGIIDNHFGFCVGMCKYTVFSADLPMASRPQAFPAPCTIFVTSRKWCRT